MPGVNIALGSSGLENDSAFSTQLPAVWAEAKPQDLVFVSLKWTNFLCFKAQGQSQSKTQARNSQNTLQTFTNAFQFQLCSWLKLSNWYDTALEISCNMARTALAWKAHGQPGPGVGRVGNMGSRKRIASGNFKDLQGDISSAATGETPY